MSKRIGKSAERRFAQFATRQTFSLLPPTVVARTKEDFLDTIGIMTRASSAPSLSGLRDAPVKEDCGTSTVIGSAFKAPPSIAVLLNGVRFESQLSVLFNLELYLHTVRAPSSLGSLGN